MLFCCHFPGLLRYSKLLAYFLQTCCLEKKNITLFSEVRIQFPSFPFFAQWEMHFTLLLFSFFYCSTECPKVCANTTGSLVNCWKYLPKVWLFFFNCSAWSLQLGRTIPVFLEFLSSFCPLPASVLQRGSLWGFQPAFHTLYLSSKGEIIFIFINFITVLEDG